MKEIKRVACLIGIVLLAAAFASATPITTSDSFTLTYSPPGGPQQLKPGGISSIPIYWNFFALDNWVNVYSIDNVQFDITLATVNQQSSFTLQLSDSLSTLMGPRTLVVDGTPGVNNSYLHTATIIDPQVLAAFLADGVVNTLLARDPGTGQPGGANNYFYFVNSTITVNAQVIPEPATYMMIGTGLAGAAFLLRRRRVV